MAKQKIPSSFYDSRYAADVAEFTKLYNYDIPKNEDNIQPLSGIDVLNFNFARSFSDPAKLATFRDNFNQFVGFKRFKIAKKYNFKNYAAFAEALEKGEVKKSQVARAEAEEFNKWWHLRREVLKKLSAVVEENYMSKKARMKLSAKSAGAATLITLGAGAFVYNDLKHDHADFVNSETQRMVEQAMETLKADYAATYGMTEAEMNQFITDNLGTDMTAFEQEMQAFQQWADGQREAWATSKGSASFAQLKQYMDSRTTYLNKEEYVQYAQNKHDSLIASVLAEGEGFATVEDAQQYIDDNTYYNEFGHMYYNTLEAVVMARDLAEAEQVLDDAQTLANDPNTVWPQGVIESNMVKSLVASLNEVEEDIDAQYEALLASHIPEDPTADQLLAQDMLQGFDGFQEQTLGDVAGQVAEQHDMSTYLADHMGEMAMAALPGAFIGAFVRTAIPAVKTMKMRKMYKTVEKILAVENEKEALPENFEGKKRKPPKRREPAKPDLTM